MTHLRAGTAVAACLALACEAPADVPFDPSDLEQAPELELTELVRIGSVDDPVAGFTRIVGLDVSEDGRVYVFDTGAGEIRVLDDAGHRVGTIGRRGEGPGEFDGTPRFGIHGDTLWTIDRSLSRITLFDLDGGVISAERYEALQLQVRSGFATVAPWAMDSDGLFRSWLVSVRSGSSDEEHSETRDSVPIPIVRFAGDGSVVDTAGWHPTPTPRLVPPAGSNSLDFVQVDGTNYMVPSAPSSLPHWTGTGGGRVETHIPPPDSELGTMAVTSLTVAGDTVFRRDLRYEATAYSSSDLDRIAESGVERSPRAPEDAAARRRAADRIRAAMAYPSHSPTVGRPEVLAHGSVWIPRMDADGRRSPEWVILEPDGNVLGRVEFPARANPEWFDGEEAWVVEYDDLDVPWLVRYRIDR